MVKKDKDNEIRFVLRVPKSIWKEFQSIADSERRSLNAEIICVIEDKINQNKKAKSQ